MNTKCIAGMIAAVLLLGGCATPSQHTFSPKAKEFRKQIAQSAPVMDWGYTVQQLRFTADQRKALVIFAKPGGGSAEMILEDDGFSRYSGAIWNEDLSEPYFREGGLKREVEALMAGTGRAQKESPTNRMENARSPENNRTPLPRLSDSHKTVIVTIPKTRPTCPHATRVREQLANSKVVKEWGYKVQELVFLTTAEGCWFCAWIRGPVSPGRLSLRTMAFAGLWEPPGATRAPINWTLASRSESW